MRKYFLISLLALASCTQQSKNEINSKYLACYALEPTAKNQCLQSFQFEAEKLGFKEFINSQGLPCVSIEDGPVFMEDPQAYLVNCKPKGQYYMRFDYDAKEWNLITEDNNND